MNELSAHILFYDCDIDYNIVFKEFREYSRSRISGKEIGITISPVIKVFNFTLRRQVNSVFAKMLFDGIFCEGITSETCDLIEINPDINGT